MLICLDEDRVLIWHSLRHMEKGKRNELSRSAVKGATKPMLCCHCARPQLQVRSLSSEISKRNGANGQANTHTFNILTKKLEFINTLMQIRILLKLDYELWERYKKKIIKMKRDFKSKLHKYIQTTSNVYTTSIYNKLEFINIVMQRRTQLKHDYELWKSYKSKN